MGLDARSSMDISHENLSVEEISKNLILEIPVKEYITCLLLRRPLYAP